MWIVILLAAAAYRPIPPSLTCTVTKDTIIVRFLDDMLFSTPDQIADKFAVVQAGSLKGGEWRFVVDRGNPEDGHPPLRLSPFRPTMKRLVIDVRRQLSVRYSERTGDVQLVRAFPAPGRYTLVFSDNLETDPDNMLSDICTVRIR